MKPSHLIRVILTDLELEAVALRGDALLLSERSPRRLKLRLARARAFAKLRASAAHRRLVVDLERRRKEGLP